MKTMQFKTTINCSGCVAAVTPLLNSRLAPGEWSVDISVPDKVLTVSSGDIDAEEVLQLVRKAGFQAERMTD